MGERKTGNFIKAYVDTYKDGFVPDKFYLWSAISTVATVLERKVWLPWSRDNMYPNLYVFLVSNPGVGKSSAIKPGYKLIQRMCKDHQRVIKFLPNKVTEPKLLDEMNQPSSFEWQNEFWPHTSAYYYASEASTCFNDIYGGLVATLTALYDGDDLSKATVSRANEVKIINPCMNIIAGCTFKFLTELLTQEGIMGGFASRILYVIHDTVEKRVSLWPENNNWKSVPKDSDLVHDLAQINALTGPFQTTPEVKEAWAAWFTEFDDKLQNTQNENLQALMVRKSTNVRKLAMVLSASFDDSMIINIDHWNLATQLMDETESKIPNMIRTGQAMNNDAGGLKAAIINTLYNNPGHFTRKSLTTQLLMRNNQNANAVLPTLGMILNDSSVVSERGGFLFFVGNPDLYL